MRSTLFALFIVTFLNGLSVSTQDTIGGGKVPSESGGGGSSVILSESSEG
jgi:hypothetical protein